MTFQFPASPTEGQIFAPAGGPQYVYRAPYWRASGRVDTITGVTPPVGPKNGQLWFNSATGNTYIWYEDPNSAQWVQINVGPGGGNFITPEMFGAVGDGVTDDTAAWTAALAQAAASSSQVVGSRKNYLVGELVIGGRAHVDLNGAILSQKSGSRWCVNMTGYDCSLRNGRIEGQYAGYVSTTASAAVTGATTVTLASAAGVETGMMLFIKTTQALMPWLATWITNVAGNVVTIASALDGDVTAGFPAYAGYGSLRISGTAYKAVVHNFYLSGVGIGVMVDGSGGTSPQLGHVEVANIAIAGFVFGRSMNGVRLSDWQVDGGRTQVNAYTGDGATTTFAIPPPISGKYFKKTDVKVYVGGVLKILITDYTINQTTNIVTMLAAPGNGVAVEVRHFFDNLFGVVCNSKGTTVAAGGGKIANGITLSSFCGIYGKDHDLYQFSNVTADSGSWVGLYTDQAVNWFLNGCEFTFMPFPIIHKTSSQGVWISGLNTVPVADSLELTPTPSKVSVTVKARGLYIDPFSWHGSDHSSVVDPATDSWLGPDVLAYDRAYGRYGFSKELLGPLKVRNSVGPVTATFAGNEVAVFDRSGTAGNSARIHLLSGNTATAKLALGDDNDSDMGGVEYSNSLERLTLYANKVAALLLNTDSSVTPGVDNTRNFGSVALRWLGGYFNQVFLGAGAVKIFSGGADPNGARTAPVGSVFLRSDGGANTTLYVKETGTGNTGWVAK